MVRRELQRLKYSTVVQKVQSEVDHKTVKCLVHVQVAYSL